MGRDCCCRCMWKQERWSDLSTGLFEFSHNVTSITKSLSLISGDGTTIGCRRRDNPDLMKIETQHTPCLEIDWDITNDLSPTPPVSYSSEWLIGQTYSDWEMLPDGASHTLNATCDGALRFLEYYARNGANPPSVVKSAGTFDASVPTAYSRGPGLALSAVQDGETYIRPIPLGATGTGAPIQFNGVDGTLVETGGTGVWTRQTYEHAGDATVNLAGSWSRVVVSPATYNAPMYVTADPDWSAGAEPIYFGWAVRQRAAMQALIGTPPADFRFTRMIQRIRIDRLCITIA